MPFWVAACPLAIGHLISSHLLGLLPFSLPAVNDRAEAAGSYAAVSWPRGAVGHLVRRAGFCASWLSLLFDSCKILRGKKNHAVQANSS